jgi:segregation and condensation protein B
MAKRKQNQQRRENEAAAEPQLPPPGDAAPPFETKAAATSSPPVTDAAAAVAGPEATVEQLADVQADAVQDPADGEVDAGPLAWQHDAETPAEPAEGEGQAADPAGSDADSASASATAWPEAAEPAPVSAAAPDAAVEAWAWPDGDPAAATEPASDAPAGESSEASDPAGEAAEAAPDGSRLLSIIESLLFASDKPLGLPDLKRLLGERDSKKVAAAVEELIQQRKGAGVEVATLSNGWALRTPPDNATWVSRLLVGRPIRLSRAMLETLAIVAYRQPVTRPEIDDIRGVDCGPVLKTLLDRGLVRIIGKKEEVGRPMLYGTTPEFLRIFNLRELAELPTLREFYDLTAEDQSRVESEHGTTTEPDAAGPKPEVALRAVSRGDLPPEAEETDPLIDELDEASKLAKQALGGLEPTAEDAPAKAPDPDGRPAADPPAESRE